MRFKIPFAGMGSFVHLDLPEGFTAEQTNESMHGDTITVHIKIVRINSKDKVKEC